MSKYEFKKFDWTKKEEKNESDLAKKSDFTQIGTNDEHPDDFSQLKDPTNYFDRFNPIIPEIIESAMIDEIKIIPEPIVEQPIPEIKEEIIVEQPTPEIKDEIIEEKSKTLKTKPKK